MCSRGRGRQKAGKEEEEVKSRIRERIRKDNRVHIDE